MKKLIANLKFLFTNSLSAEFTDVNDALCEDEDSIRSASRAITLLNQRITMLADDVRAHKAWAISEMGGVAEAIEGVVKPLDYQKVCIPCPDTLEQRDWVTVAYFCNSCGLNNPRELSEVAYTAWRETHNGAEPSRSKHNEAYIVYPVGYLRDVVNGRYDPIINK